VLLLANPGEITGDAGIFRTAYERLGGRVRVATTPDAITGAMQEFASCATLVDAILGTGVKGEVTGAPGAAIDHWPAGVYTVAVDVPSGLNADTGEVCGRAIHADVTVTFQFMKRGFENPAAKKFLGRLEVVDIGIPPACADDEAWRKLTNA
jgi:NAD(P)H-hydrate epimerase